MGFVSQSLASGYRNGLGLYAKPCSETPASGTMSALGYIVLMVMPEA